MSSAAPFVYPATAKGDKVDEYFGTKIADPYQARKQRAHREGALLERCWSERTRFCCVVNCVR